MRGLFLTISIVILFCCVTVGAFNVVTDSNNRPMFAYASLLAISEIEFSIDDTKALIDDIRRSWCGEHDFVKDICSKCSVSLENYEASSKHFGSPDYDSTTGIDIVDGFLEGLSSSFSTLVSILGLLYNFIKDIVNVVITLFDLILKFLVGVPS